MGIRGRSRRAEPIWYDCTCQTCGHQWSHYCKGPPRWDRCPAALHPWRDPKDRSAFITFNSYMEIVQSRKIRQELSTSLKKLKTQQRTLLQKEQTDDRESGRKGSRTGTG